MSVLTQRVGRQLLTAGRIGALQATGKVRWQHGISLYRWESSIVLSLYHADRSCVFRSGKVATMTTYVNRAGQLTGFRQYPGFGIVLVPKGPQLIIMSSPATGFPFIAYLSIRLILQGQ